MPPWLLVLAVLVPALFYATLLYGFDVHEREPPWALAMLFLAGAACVPLAGALELWVDGLHPFVAGLREGRLSAARFGCFLVISPIEELTKLAVVALLARRRLMNEPVDGVVYAGIAALGFASAEGLIAAQATNPSTVMMRAFLATPGHLCFSALWGAGLGALRYYGRPVLPSALSALFASLIAHGTYDYLLVADQGRDRGAVVAVLATGATVTAILFRSLLQVSPFRGVTPRAGHCASCGHAYRARSRFCAECGAQLARMAAPPLPLGFAATMLGFAAQAVVLVSSTVLLSRLHGESALDLWSSALSEVSHETVFLAVIVTLGSLASGACARAYAGRFAVLEAWFATSLALLCALLFLALTAPGTVTHAIWLAPPALIVSGLSAQRRGARAS